MRSKRMLRFCQQSSNKATAQAIFQASLDEEACFVMTHIATTRAGHIIDDS